MYIGDPGRAGVSHLVNELVANSVDHYVAGQATRVAVSQRGDRICVEDDGPGLPYDQLHPSGRTVAERYFVDLDQTAREGDPGPLISFNPTGMRLIVASALSSHLEVVTHRAGYRWEQHFEKGMPVSDPVRTKSKGRGTTIIFALDGEVLEAQEPQWASLRHRLFEVAHLFPGIRIGCREEVFHMPDGLFGYALFLKAAYVGELMAGQSKAVLDADLEMDGVRIVAAAYGTAKICEWHSWCHERRTNQHGTHVAGFSAALKAVGWTPSVALINVQTTNPRYAGGTRSKLTNENVRTAVRRAIKAHLKAHPPQLDSFIY